MRKVTQVELEPLVELLRQEALTVPEIEDRCGVSRETAYRYLRTMKVPPPELLSRVRRADGAKAWQIVRAA